MNTRTSFLQPALTVSFTVQTNWMLNSQVSGVAIQQRLRYSQSLKPANCKGRFQSSVLILLDLSAAFDTVNHQILLSTLSSLGITGIPLRWFESYLTGRSFRVAWGGEVSKAHQLVTGVPQGSVLWTPPLLHIHYITGTHHTGTWLLLHSSISLSTR